MADSTTYTIKTKVSRLEVNKSNTSFHGQQGEIIELNETHIRVLWTRPGWKPIKTWLARNAINKRWKVES